jgi:hypothetical protein
LLRLGIFDGQVDHLREFGGSMELVLLQVLDVVLNDLLDSTHHDGVEVVAIEGKTLPHILVVGGQLGSKSIQGNLIIVVKILQHTNYLPDSLNIGICAVDYFMQTHPILRVRIAEVDPQNQVEGRPVNDVRDEAVSNDLSPLVYLDHSDHKAVLVDPL